MQQQEINEKSEIQIITMFNMNAAPMLLSPLQANLIHLLDLYC